MRLLIHPTENQIYAIRIMDIAVAYELYINGALQATSGQPASSKEHYSARNVPQTISFSTDKSVIDIVIHVANFSKPTKGGIVQSISFGSDRAIDRYVLFSIGTQLMVAAILLIHGLFAIILYLIGNRQKELLFFSALIVFAILTILVADDRLLFHWFPMSHDWNVKIGRLAFLGASFLLPEFITRLLPHYRNMAVFRWYYVAAAAILLFNLIAPVEILLSFAFLNTVFAVGSFLAALFLVFHPALKGENYEIYILLAGISITLNLIWGNLYGYGFIPSKAGYYPLDTVFTFLLFATF